MLDVGGAAVREAPGAVAELPDGEEVAALGWSRDGQILTAATAAGGLVAFLAAPPRVAAAGAGRVARLAALRELCVVDCCPAAVAGAGAGASGITSGGANHITAVAPARLEVDLEPAFVAVGPRHAAAGLNNEVLFYALEPGAAGPQPRRPPAARRRYLGAVAGLWLSAAHAAALVDGRLLVHTIEPAAGEAAGGAGGGGGNHFHHHHDGDDGDDVVVLPPPSAGSGMVQQQQQQQQQQLVTCAGLTDHFAVLGTAGGSLLHYALPGLEPVSEHRHGSAILRVWPQPGGVRAVFEDAARRLFLFCAADGAVHPLPGLDAAAGAGAAAEVAWDCLDARVFVVAEAAAGPAAPAPLHAFLLATPLGAPGPEPVSLARAQLPATHAVAVVANGAVTCRVGGAGGGGSGGDALDVVVLESHRTLQAPLAPPAGASHTVGAGAGAMAAAKGGLVGRRFAQALALQRFDEAWRCALLLRSADAWAQLGAAALEALNLGVAEAAYRHAGDASAAASLESLAGAEDRALLAGHAALVLGRDADLAQDCFLRSGDPLAALDMRRDLKHWAAALDLARRLAPREAPGVARQHAAALEMVGEHEAARAHYEEALEAAAAMAAMTEAVEGQDTSAGEQAGGGDQAAHRRACMEGLARTRLRLGDIAGGKTAALQVQKGAVIIRPGDWPVWSSS